MRPGWDESLESLRTAPAPHPKSTGQVQSFQVLGSAHMSRGHKKINQTALRHILSEGKGAKDQDAGSAERSKTEPLMPLVDATHINSLSQGLSFLQESEKTTEHHAGAQGNPTHHGQVPYARAPADAGQSQKGKVLPKITAADDGEDNEEKGKSVQNITAAEMLAGKPATALLTTSALVEVGVRRGISLPMWTLAVLSIVGGVAFSWRLYAIWSRGERFNIVGAGKAGMATLPGHTFPASRAFMTPLVGNQGRRWCNLEEWIDLASPHALERVSIERSSVPDQVLKAQMVRPDLLRQISAVMDGTPSPDERNWASKSLADVFLLLGLMPDGLKTGLSHDAAQRRLDFHGMNELETKEVNSKSVLHVCLSAILSKTGVLVLLAAVFATFLDDFRDSVTLVGGIVFASISVVAFGRRLHSSSQAVSSSVALRLKARCLREGNWVQISASELVPGDVVRIVAGDRVSADLRVVEADGLLVDETLLSGVTGDKVEKHGVVERLDVGNCGLAENIVYAHTNVIKGSGLAIVVETGMNVRLGRLYKSLAQAGGVANMLMWMNSTPAWHAVNSWGGPLIVTLLILNIVSFFVSGLAEFDDPDAPSASDKGWRYQLWLRAAQVALLISAKVVPQMVPSWCVFCLSVGGERARQKGALIRKFGATESLSTCTTICSDMSGIFTEGWLTAVNLFGSLPDSHTFEFDDSNGADCVAVYLMDRSSRPKRIDQDISKSENGFVKSALTLACMNCDGGLSPEQEVPSRLVSEARSEASIVELAQRSGLDARKICEDFPTVLEVPFNSSNRLRVTIHALPQGTPESLPFQMPANASHVAVIKGAPERLLPCLTRGLSLCQQGDGWEICRRDPELLQGLVESQNSCFAAAGLRVLLCGMLPLTEKEFSALQDMSDVAARLEAILHDLVFVSLMSFKDPVKDQVRPAVDKCLLGGIRVVMVTGEQLDTAQAVARSIGIPGKAKLAATLRLSCGAFRASAEIMDLCAQVDVWARVQPEDKLVITKALQESGRVCVVTGGSVDDVAVLNQADVGIALGSGKAVAKHVADIVLTESSFSGAVDAVEGARQTSSNLMKAVMYWLGINVGEFLGHTLGLVLQLPKSFSSSSLLLGLVASALGVLPLCWEPAEQDVIPKTPPQRKSSLSLTGRRLQMLPMWLGLPLVMIGTTYAGLVLHLGTARSHHIIGLCDYAWHSDGVHRWKRDEAPYHCHSPALGSHVGEQWGRQQTEENNINAEFRRTSGSTGQAYAKNDGPFKDGLDFALEPCNGRPGPPEGSYCWKEAFLVPSQVVHPDGIESASGEMWPRFRNFLLHPEWNCARYGTRLAKSMGWFATILTQALFLQSLRSPQPLQVVFLRNPTAVASLLATVIVALLALYLPVVNDVLRLAPLPPKSLLLACVGPFCALGLAEASKTALRRTASAESDASC